MNTKFFHSRAKSRKKKNMIKGLEDDLGVWHEKEPKVVEIIEDYFSTIFKSSQPTNEDLEPFIEAIGSGLSESHRAALESPFTAKEVKKAVFEMAPDKSPGPDGFHTAFFQKSWDIVGEEVTGICLGVLHSFSSVKVFSRIFVTLIPKINNPRRMADFRPISLCNVIYKIITKALANRLKLFLDPIISQSQSAFVLGLRWPLSSFTLWGKRRKDLMVG